MDDAVIHHSADQLKQESQLSQWYGIRRRANRNRTSKIAHFFYKLMIVKYEIRIMHCRQGRLMEQRERPQIKIVRRQLAATPSAAHSSLCSVQCSRGRLNEQLQCCDVAL